MVKHGYKQTEIGVIPEDWDVDTIKSITFSVATGGNYKNSTQISPYPLIKMGNISRGNINVSKIEYVTDTIPSEKDRLIYGDVLFNTRNTPELVGKVAIWKNELPIAYFNSNLLRFNFNLEKSNPFFMNLIFNTEQVISEFKNIAKGTTSVAAIYPQDMLKVLIKIPPLPEQKRIAEALSDVDSMISSLEKLIAKKKAVKQGAMQELLTGKKRLPGFDGEWRSILLEDVCVFYNGGTPSKKRSDWWNGCIPWISSSDLCENSITSVSINRYITQDALDHSATRLCPKNAVSIVSRVGVGKVAVTPCELCTSQDFTTIVSSAYNPYFLAYMLVPIMKDMAMQAQGTSIKGVTVEDIAKIKISTPSIKEQNQIVSILSDMDNEIEALEHKLEKTHQIKQGMMQQLLTGKIRLV